MNAKSKKTNPNRNFYIAIGVMCVIILAIIVFFVYEAVNNDDTNYSAPSQSQSLNSQTTQTPTNSSSGEVDKSDASKVLFTMNDGQTFTMEVYPKIAPVTVANFLDLVNSGFYNGLTFHRVIEGFMAQGGAYDPINQANDPADSINGEFTSNGFENNLKHERGVVSMARTMDPNSASSQFFICYDSVPHLDGEYAAFGCVIEGMETVDSFLSEGTDANDVPLKEVVIKEAKVIK